MGSTVCIKYETRSARRIFTPKKIGNIVCRMLLDTDDSKVGKSGLSLRQALADEIQREIDICISDTDSDIDQAKQQAQSVVLANALDLVQQNQLLIGVSIAVLTGLLIVPRVFAALPAAVVGLIPFLGVARVAVSTIPGTLATLRVQQAANAAFFRAAANAR